MSNELTRATGTTCRDAAPPPAAASARVGPLEHDIQASFFEWWSHFCRVVKVDERLCFAIPNGAKLPWRRDKKGKRFSPEAVRLKREGLRSGVPDVMLAVVRNGLPGLYLEFKRKGGKPDEGQEQLIALLRLQGYHVLIVWSLEEAMRAVMAYLGYRANQL